MLFPPVRRVSLSDIGAAATYAAGAIAGGLVSALGFWTVGGLLNPLPVVLRRGILLAGIVWASIAQLTPLLSVPQRKHQIPQEVLLGQGWMGIMQFGFEIGTGMRTYLPTSAAHVLALFLLLGTPTIVEALAVGLGFGLGRALQLFSTAIVADRESFLEGWSVPVACLAGPSPLMAAIVVGLVVLPRS